MAQTYAGERARAYRWAVDRAYQEAALPGVSRTFALTIPQLPKALRDTVTNAYLLCRIADTLEDHSRLEPGGKQDLFVALQEVLQGQREAPSLAHEVESVLAPSTPTAERDLVLSLPRVVSVTAGLDQEHREAVIRCVSIMGGGMARFQRLKSPAGLPDRATFESYCYYVAGVVGEMLTDLFAMEVEGIAQQRDEMMELGRRFGLGLQATNVIKDVWDDRARGLCWLPRDVFADVGCDLEPDEEWSKDPAFSKGIVRMVAIGTEHMEAARSYINNLPTSEPGIRRFCAWAATMSFATLRRILKRPGFDSAEKVKISRRQVRRLAAWSNYGAEHEGAMRMVLAWSSRGLPRPLVKSHGEG